MAEYIVRMEPEHPEYQVLVGDVVRCRDCKHHRMGKTQGPYCWLHSHRADPDGYCAWSEPKEA